MAKAKTKTDRPVVVCTAHRGVFFGYTDRPALDIVKDQLVELRGARMAIRWGTTRGVMELAETGPTDNGRVGSEADIALNAVTAVFEVTAGAEKAWVSS